MRFTVPGKPFGKARPRKGKFGIYNPKENVAYEKKITEAYINTLGHIPEPTDKPVWINIEAHYPIPKQTPKKKRELMLAGKMLPLIRPDGDNIVKSVLDALNGVAYFDDKQVVLIRVNKTYAEKGETIIDIGRYYNAQ